MNLENLSHILPFALSNSLGYTSYYYYSKITTGDLGSLLFPYYIITPHCVLTLSADLSSAIVHTDAEIIRQYTATFQTICRHAEPFIVPYATLEEVWRAYVEPINGPVTSMKVLEPQICIFNMIKPELFSSMMQNLSPELRQLGKEIITQEQRSSMLEQRHYYTRWGMKLFIETGCFIGHLGAFFPPLSVKLRIDALEHYLKDSQKHSFYMLKDHFKLPRHLNFELYDNGMMQITQIDEDKKVSLFRIKESSIYEAFIDFEASLPDSEFVYSPEEEKRMILDYISLLKKQI